MDTFQVHILAADRTFYEGPCVSLTIPTSDGEQGILAHHSPMIAAVQTGTLRWQTPGGGVELAAVSPGMVKVEKNEVLVLVDSAEPPGASGGPGHPGPGVEPPAGEVPRHPGGVTDRENTEKGGAAHVQLL